MIAQLTTRRGQPRPLAAVPVLALSMLMAGCGSAAAAGGTAGAPVAAKTTAGPAAPAQRHPAAGPPAIGTAQARSRSQVPWAKVGPGWELVQYSTGTATPPVKPGPTTLYLVDPGGGRYELYRWPATPPAPALVAWSGDKSRALLSDVPASNRLVQLTLATGKTSSITLPANASAIGYTRPDGTSVLAERLSGQNYVAVGRYTLHGQLELRLAAGNGAGAGVIESPDGTELVIAAAAGLELISNAGQPIRMLPVRAPSASCSPLRYWSAQTVLASCGTSSGSRRLWLVPLGGGAPAALTPARGSRGPDFGDVGAWHLASGLYLQALGACGDEFIARQHPNGSVSVVSVPGAPADDNRIITAAGGRLLVLALTGCESSNSLLWFDPATNAEQWLFPAPHNVSGVVGVIPYYSTENQRLS